MEEAVEEVPNFGPPLWISMVSQAFQAASCGQAEMEQLHKV